MAPGNHSAGREPEESFIQTAQRTVVLDVRNVATLWCFTATPDYIRVIRIVTTAGWLIRTIEILRYRERRGRSVPVGQGRVFAAHNSGTWITVMTPYIRNHRGPGPLDFLSYG
jgi:hypothetical protein